MSYFEYWHDLFLRNSCQCTTNNYEWADPYQIIGVDSSYKSWSEPGYPLAVTRAMDTWNSVKQVNTNSSICNFQATASSANKITRGRLFNTKIAAITEFNPYYESVPAHTKINSFVITLNTTEVNFADGAKFSTATIFKGL